MSIDFLRYFIRHANSSAGCPNRDYVVTGRWPAYSFFAKSIVFMEPTVLFVCNIYIRLKEKNNNKNAPRSFLTGGKIISSV